MSEQLKHPETGFEAIDLSAEIERNKNRLKSQHESKDDAQQSTIEALQHTAEIQAISKDSIAVGEKETRSTAASTDYRQLKKQAYARTLHRIQSHLKPQERSFSRLIHKPTIEKISNVGAQTIANPNGVLWGGVFALLGSGVLLYIAKHYGLTYNFTVVFGCFFAGFGFGIIIDLIQRKRANKNPR